MGMKVRTGRTELGQTVNGSKTKCEKGSTPRGENIPPGCKPERPRSVEQPRLRLQPRGSSPGTSPGTEPSRHSPKHSRARPSLDDPPPSWRHVQIRSCKIRSVFKTQTLE